MNTITYELNNSLYVNITNRCSNDCVFCVRNSFVGDGVFGVPQADAGINQSLWLDTEPTVEEIKADFARRDLAKYDEVVFCGFGEPMMRYDTVLEIAAWLKAQYGGVKIRLNTNGQANLIAGYDITPKLAGIPEAPAPIDTVSISLNAKTAAEYEEMCRSVYGGAAYPAILEFARLAKNHVKNVMFTVVDIMEEDDIAVCGEIAKACGVGFRVRKMM